MREIDNKTKIQDEIVKNLPDNLHGLLLIAPRVGKSRIMIEHIKKTKPDSILWVTPSVKLRDIDIPQEFIKWKAKKYLRKLTTVCWSSLENVKGSYELIVLDEYQKVTYINTFNLIIDHNIYFKRIIGLSGTHPRGEEKQLLLDELYLEVHQTIDISQAIKQGLISDYSIKVVEVCLDSINKNVVGGSKAKPFMTTEANQYSYLSRNIMKNKFFGLKRMHLIYESPSKEKIAVKLLENLKGRKLIFAGSIDQAERLSPYTYHSKTTMDDLNKFMANEIDILACVKAGGVGFTYRNVDYFIIIQADSDKTGETSQRFARSLLTQGDYKATVIFICLMGTVDEKWLESFLENLDNSKVERLTQYQI